MSHSAQRSTGRILTVILSASLLMLGITAHAQSVDFTPTDDALSTPEGVAIDIDIESDLLANDGADADASSVTVSAQPTDGTLDDSVAGTLTYTPNDDFVGDDTFTYEVCPEGSTDPADCGSAKVTITVNQQIAIDGPQDGDTTGERPTLHGTTEPNTQVTVYIDGDKAQEFQANGQGDWTMDAGPLSEGEHTIKIDAQNGTSITVTITVKADDDSGDNNTDGGDNNNGGETDEGPEEGLDPDVPATGGHTGSCNAAGGGMSGGGIAILALLAGMALIERRRRNA